MSFHDDAMAFHHYFARSFERNEFALLTGPSGVSTGSANKCKRRAELVNVEDFKDALSCFPSGVVIVTTVTLEGIAKGFTASSFTSVSANPPLILACLNTNAECFSAFASAASFGVSVLRPRHEQLARVFARRGADKFAGEEFILTEDNLPVVKHALATLICNKSQNFLAGDHIILLGEVNNCIVGDPGPGMVHYQRRFWGVGEGVTL